MCIAIGNSFGSLWDVIPQFHWEGSDCDEFKNYENKSQAENIHLKSTEDMFDPGLTPS